MGLFDVLLGIDRAARDTGRRIECRVLAADRYSAAMMAETMADRTLQDPAVEYTHAMQVNPVTRPACVATRHAMAA